MSALSRGIGTGLAGGLLALDKRIDEDRIREQEYGNQMTLAEYQAKVQKDIESMKLDYRGKMQDKDIDFRTGIAQDQIASAENIARIRADAQSQSVLKKPTDGQYKAAIASIGYNLTKLFPELFPADTVMLFDAQDPSKLAPGDIDNIFSTVKKAADSGKNPQAASLWPWLDMYNDLRMQGASAESLSLWKTSMLSVIEKLSGGTDPVLGDSTVVEEEDGPQFRVIGVRDSGGN